MSTCTIVIKDETNIQFMGLDPATRRNLVNAVKFKLPYAHNLPAVRLGRWDGTVDFCDMASRSYLNLLDRLLPKVMDAGYDVEIDDRRFAYNFEFDPVTNDSFTDIKWPQGHPLS